MSNRSYKKNGSGQGHEIIVTTKIIPGAVLSDKADSKGKRSFRPTKYKTVESWHHGEHSANVAVLSKGDIGISPNRSFPIFGTAVISKDDFKAMLVEQSNRLISEGELCFQNGGLSVSA